MRLFVWLVAFVAKYSQATSPPVLGPLLTCEGFYCDIGKCEMRAPLECASPPCALLPTCTNEHQIKPAMAVGNALDCGQNAEFTECGSSCEDTCERNCFPTGQCAKNVCRCKSGFVRKDGNCIARNACSATNCARNETYDVCGGCERKCGDPSMLSCSMICRPGKCVCSLGFVRNQQGNCVIEKDCTGQPGISTTTAPTTCTKSNEELRTCGSRCEPSCERTMPICTQECVLNVCQCKLGFFRNNNGECVPLQQCSAQPGVTTTVRPHVCAKENEELKQCGSRCEPSCDRITPICTKECVPNICQCKLGFFRNITLQCVPLQQCSAKPTCSQDNEELKECGSRCEPACNNTTPICTKECVTNVCQCKTGFYRDLNGLCVGLQRCSAIPACTKPNEEFKTCGTRCEATCNNTNPICTMDCIPNVCQCITGYARNSKGDCIKTIDCSSNDITCKPAEVFKSCGTACEPSCDNPVPAFCTDNCIVNVCQCAPGYYRDKTSGNCVAQAYCNVGSSSTVRPRQICTANEDYTDCGTACEATCNNPNPICTKQCIPNVCQCKAGLIRSPVNASCIQQQACPSVANCNLKFNEEFKECGSACEPTCSQLHSGPNMACPAVCVNNVCQCKTGFYRNSTGVCVEEKQCETTPICTKANEELKTCGTQCEATCNNTNPICTFDCVPNVCQCLAGYVRNIKGDCIRKTECTSNDVTCKQAEVFKTCGTACEPSCDNPVPAFCTDNCIVNVCQCAPGYYRDETSGNCVALAYCNAASSSTVRPRPICSVNEDYTDCGTACEATFNNPNPICTKQCIPNICQCKAGFVRSSVNGSCIQQQACPSVSNCNLKQNEEFKECGSACEPTCSQLTSDIKAKIACPDVCINNVCQCKIGFYRNSTGSCVEEKQCEKTSSTCLGLNEELKGCGTMCEPTCDNKTPMCNRACKVNACQCRIGFIRNSNGICIAEEQCPAENPCNLMDCAEGLRCEVRNVTCIRAPCNPIGVCVKLSASSCSHNESFAGCGGCDQRCGEASTICTRECKPAACLCKTGYSRNSQGLCVLEKDCEAVPALTCANIRCGFGTVCKMVDVQCIRAPCPARPQCVNPEQTLTCINMECAAGKVCKEIQVNCLIPPCPAPEPVCVDQETNTCMNVRCTAGTFCEMVDQNCNNPPCQRLPQCINETSVTCASTSCLAGQECRMVQVICKKEPCNPIPMCQASTPSCGRNEIYDSCGGCEQSCIDSGNKICPAICRPGACVCARGYYRNTNGSCVIQDECIPALTCANIRCSADKVCKMVNVQCLRAPCPPQPQCVEPVVKPSCMTVKCAAGSSCVMVNSQFCSKLPCDSQPRCLNDTELKCNTMDCQSGLSCQYFDVQCLMAPCYPQPRCVVNNPITSCANKKCPVGTACKEIKVNCLIPPCIAQEPICEETNTCLNVPCSAGTSCSMVDDNCGSPPCARSPQCLNDTIPTCASMSCLAGQECRMVNVLCVTTPCYPIPRCGIVSPSQCGINETYDNCGGCEQSCTDNGNKVCPLSCHPGACVCSSGYSRNASGSCIRQADCYLSDPAGPSCSTVKCASGTHCVLSQDNDCKIPPCIPAPTCVADSQCGINEKFTECVCEQKCGQTVQICAAICTKGCQCAPGFKRNNQGLCIHEDQCSLQNPNPVTNLPCPTNQTYSNCPPQTDLACNLLDAKVSAPTKCSIPRCTCSEGYARNGTGICVKIADCGVKNATSCGTAKCESWQTCESAIPGCNKPPCTPIHFCTPTVRPTTTKPTSQPGSVCAATSCPTGSICREVPLMCNPVQCFYKAECVPAANNTACGKNEMWDNCGGCETKCGELKSCPASCRPGACVCAFGYYRQGPDCVSMISCDTESVKNATSCGSAKCESWQTCGSAIPGCNKPPCTPVHFCSPNVRPTTTKPTSQPEPTKCGKNEIMHPCNKCEPTCDKPNTDCSKAACNNPSCVCAPGFVRKDGQCVTWKQCPAIPDNKGSQCGNNEVFSKCKPTCELTCKGTEQMSECSGNSSKCTSGCVCRPFYKRDDKGKCIHQKFCYKHTTCEDNEEWSKCMQCESKCGSKNTNCDSLCTSGCACSEGYSRNSKGKCVKKC